MQKTKLVPPIYFLCTLLLMGALHFAYPIARFLDSSANFLGIAVVCVGFAVSMTAAGMFRSAGTPVIPFERSTTLVTTGIYRFTRNPMYLGLVIMTIGVAILCGTVATLLPIPIFIGIIRTRFVLREERFLEDIFGEQYRTYKGSVRRWI